MLLLLLSGGWLVTSLHSENRALPSGPPEQIAAVPILLALSTVVALRRRAPEKMLVLATGPGIAQLVTDVEVNPSNFAFLVILFTVASRRVRWASHFALGGAIVAPTIATLRWPDPDQTTNMQGIDFGIYPNEPTPA